MFSQAGKAHPYITKSIEHNSGIIQLEIAVQIACAKSLGGTLNGSDVVLLGHLSKGSAIG